MGLRLEFSIDDLGLPDVLESDNFTVPVDYSDAFAEFVDVFIEKACDLVPVDTGFLMSTIDGDCDDQSCEVYADADYAQYVEYGTWKMDAQPYFEPAVDAAANAFWPLVQSALNEAQKDLESLEEALAEEEEQEQQAQQEQMAMQQQAQQEGMAGAMAQGGGSFLGSIVATVVVMAIMWLPMAIMYGIADSISGGALSHGGGGGEIDDIGSLGGEAFENMIEIY